MQRKLSGVQGVSKVKLSAFALEPPCIVVDVDETVTWVIGKNDRQYSSVYRPGERYFILAINELGVESEKLYQDDSFEFKFTTPGTFTITCLNYPGIKQRVKVTLPWKISTQGPKFSESRNGTDETSDNLKSPRDSSEKEIDIVGVSKADDGMEDINKCLKMFIKGCPEEEIKDNFKHLFVNKKLFFDIEEKESDEELDSSKEKTPDRTPKDKSRIWLKRKINERPL